MALEATAMSAESNTLYEGEKKECNHSSRSLSLSLSV